MTERLTIGLILAAFLAAVVWAQDGLLGARPAGSADTDAQIASLQEQVRKTPDDFAGYDRLGEAFLQKARETGDLAYYELAERALEKTIGLAPQDFRAADPLVHLALVYMGEHRFDEVLKTTQRAIGLGAGNLAAFAIEGDAYTDLGDYDKAGAAYSTVERLGAASQSPLTLAYMVDSRLAYLKFLHGDSAGAIELMNDAIAAALQKRVAGENLAWLYFELGERYFQSGDLASAEQSYQAGMAADTNHYRSLAGLAKVRAAQGKLAESAELYQRSLAVIPFPAYAAELGDVYHKMGKSAEAQQQYDLVEYIGQLSLLNRVLANRELAVFYADQNKRLPEALELARRELEARHDVYTWDALAWVLYKNGRLPEAADAAGKALHLGTDDALMLFHSGMIARAMGDDAKAMEMLSRAMKINPQFHLFYADEARRTLEEIRERGANSRSSHE